MIKILAMLLSLSALADPVIGIADGDTLTVLHNKKPLKIRLANIDAPEKKQGFGEKSKQSLSEMCFRKDASYDVKAIDKYGRSVAVVTCGGVEANRAQVERGMAWVYPQYNTDDSLPAIQDAAKADRKGLWLDASPVPPWEFRHPGSAKHETHKQAKKHNSGDSECYTGPRGGRFRVVNGHKRYGC